MEDKMLHGLDGGIKLTKKEYFAARAMEGLLSNSSWMTSYGGESYLMKSEVVAKISLEMANSLLDVLNSND